MPAQLGRQTYHFAVVWFPGHGKVSLGGKDALWVQK